MEEKKKAIGYVSSAVVVLLGIGQAWMESYEAKTEAGEAEVKSKASYEALAPAISEIQDILEDANEWADDTDEEIEALQDHIRELELVIAEHKAYFAFLKRTDRRLVRVEAPEPPPRYNDGLGFPRPTKPKAAKPSRDVPKSLDSAVQQMIAD